MGIRILYYGQHDGAWSVPDHLMRAVFDLMAEEDLVRRVFYDGKVIDSAQFVETMKCKSNTVVLALDDHAIGKEILLAIAWLNGHGPNHAFAHFCVFRAARKITKDVAGTVMGFWWSLKRPSGGPLLRVIMGKTPENNRAATIFLRRIGMKILGTVPAICWDAYERKSVGGVISYKERTNGD